MALILKIALIGLAVVLVLSVFDVIVVGLIYLVKVKTEKESEEEECIT